MSSIEALKKQLLEDANVSNNIAAANQLGNVPEREEAIRILKRGFEIPDPNLHIALIKALVKQGAKEAIPQISACLRSFNPSVRNTAIQALVNPNIRGVRVVNIFKERMRFERDNSVKVLMIQKSAELPFKETVDFLLDLLKDDEFRVSPFIESFRQSLPKVAHIAPQKLIEKLDSPIGDEIATILTNIDLTMYPDVWDSIIQSLDVDPEALNKKLRGVIVGQITRDYNEKRVNDMIKSILSVEASGRMKERCIEIIGDISKTPHGPTLIRPTLQLLKERSEEEIKREKFIEDLELEIRHFDIARQCFEEVRSSYIKGNFRAAIILAISALESCVKTDYIRNVGAKEGKHEEQSRGYVRKTYLSQMLDRYFDSKDINRLPNEYKPFLDIHRKIRNSLVHPEEFTFSESVVRNALVSIAELIKHLEGKQ